VATLQHVRRLGIERARRLVVDFGRDLRDARRQAGLSLRQVGAAVGISHSQVSRIERGLVPNVSIDLATRLAAAAGLDLSIRTFPGGVKIRDAGQVRLLNRFAARIPPAMTWRTEVAVGGRGDPRAWDGTLEAAGRRCGIEAVVHVHDWQALDRRISLRRRDTGIETVLLVLADTRHNRVLVRSLGPGLISNFPEAGALALAALREGRLPRASAIVLV
jgi:transcriptional regulator with XRE-family HTH domain